MSTSDAPKSDTPISDTPKSDTPASDAFIGSMTSVVNHDDVSAILEAQTHMMSRFEKTNEMLSNFNNLSAARYEKTLEQYKDHTQTLLEMKKDLDSIFRRIRFLKTKLSKDYPDAFETASKEVKGRDLDDEEEEDYYQNQRHIRSNIGGRGGGESSSSSKTSTPIPTINTQDEEDKPETPMTTNVLTSIN